jgi:hypothetical protein
MLFMSPATAGVLGAGVDVFAASPGFAAKLRFPNKGFFSSALADAAGTEGAGTGAFTVALAKVGGAFASALGSTEADVDGPGTALAGPATGATDVGPLAPTPNLNELDAAATVTPAAAAAGAVAPGFSVPQLAHFTSSFLFST